MAVIWVVFGHSAVISNNEKWPADIGGIEPGTRNRAHPKNTKFDNTQVGH